MNNSNMSDTLNPEVIKTLEENIEIGKSDLIDDEKNMQKGGWHKKCEKCCCPKIIKFNIWADNVCIENKNAACTDDNTPPKSC